MRIRESRMSQEKIARRARIELKDMAEIAYPDRSRLEHPPRAAARRPRLVWVPVVTDENDNVATRLRRGGEERTIGESRTG